MVSLGTFTEILAVASKKFHIEAKRIFVEDGAEVDEDDVEVLRDNDRLFVSSEEPFFKNKKDGPSDLGEGNELMNEDDAEPYPKKRRRNAKQKLQSQNCFLNIVKKNHFIDKTLILPALIKFIFLNRSLDSPEWDNEMEFEKSDLNQPFLFIAPRRFGKTTVLHLLESFFTGTIPQDVLKSLNIYKLKNAMKWFGKYCVVSVTFWTMFRHKSSYIIPWVDARKTKQNKTKEDISAGIKLLVECMVISHKYEKPCILLMDEFDLFGASALFKTEQNTLMEIINFYSQMIGQVVKHSLCCQGIFTGITRLTSAATASLSNMVDIRVFDNHHFSPYYGVTLEEFDLLLQDPATSQNTRNLKSSALSVYNGYNLGNISLLNILSVREFLRTGKVEEYWKLSGISIELSEALRSDMWRKVGLALSQFKVLNMKPLKSIPHTAFSHVRSHCHEIVDGNVFKNLLLQQGYLFIKNRIDDNNVEVQIPNVEVQSEFKAQLLESIQVKFTYNQDSIRKCQDRFLGMDFTDEEDDHRKLKEVQMFINEMIQDRSNKKKINEKWLEGFLFHVFVENFAIETQEGIPETAKNGDLRTSKVFDLFLESRDRCYVIEESTIRSAKKSLKTIIDKQYYIPAEKTSKPFMLIGMSLEKSNRNTYKIKMCYLINKISGEGREVL